MRPSTLPAALLAALVLVPACATTSSGPKPVSSVARFSASSPMKVLFVDLVAEGGVPDTEVLSAADLFLNAFAAARQAEVLLARDLPELREESAARSFVGNRSPDVLGQRAREYGADFAVTGFVTKLSDNQHAFGVQAVDSTGRRVDAKGGKVGGDISSVDAALRVAGERLLAPMPEVDGPPATADVARAIKARSGLFDRCYALGLRRSRTLVGRAVVQVTVKGMPEPAEVRVVNSSFNDAKIDACFVEAARGMKLPVVVGEATLNVPVAYAE